MPRQRPEPVALTSLQRKRSAEERAASYHRMAALVNPAARNRLLEKAAYWEEVARSEAKAKEDSDS